MHSLNYKTQLRHEIDEILERKKRYKFLFLFMHLNKIIQLLSYLLVRSIFFLRTLFLLNQ